MQCEQGHDQEVVERHSGHQDAKTDKRPVQDEPESSGHQDQRKYGDARAEHRKRQQVESIGSGLRRPTRGGQGPVRNGKL